VISEKSFVKSSYLKDPLRMRERTIKTLAPFSSLLSRKRMQKKIERIRIDNKRRVGKLKKLPMRMPMTKRISA
jgi:hypothetical protein